MWLNSVLRMLRQHIASLKRLRPSAYWVQCGKACLQTVRHACQAPGWRHSLALCLKVSNFAMRLTVGMLNFTAPVQLALAHHCLAWLTAVAAMTAMPTVSSLPCLCSASGYPSPQHVPVPPDAKLPGVDFRPGARHAPTNSICKCQPRQHQSSTHQSTAVVAAVTAGIGKPADHAAADS